MNPIALSIASAIDEWRVTHPDVTVADVLAALEEVRFELTEALLR
jgi:hypothetical protein